MQSFGIQQLISDDYMHPLRDREREMRQTFSKDCESNLVELEANVEKLVGYLVEDDDIQIVSVTGMGGLGKTTLARQVFNHDMVKNKFDRLAWVYVSQEFTKKCVWQTILRNLKPKEEEEGIFTMTEDTLHLELYGLLETSKSLIVLDDIWKEEDWDLIKQIFPPRKGWKVLLTSRTVSVARLGNTTSKNLQPDYLSDEDSWTLWLKIALPRMEGFKVNEKMTEMAHEMITHCRGLPLAIKVLGGLLPAKCTEHDWKRLSENIGSHIVRATSGSNGSIDNVLSTSFEELPSYLKHCFLYLAHFREDQEINVEKLSYYWAAEGIFEPRYYHGETIRDVADGWIEELVRRNIVIAERDIKTSRFETCHLHDMMREVCMLKAKEENFLQTVTISSMTSNSQSLCRSRRLLCQSPTAIHVERNINDSKFRSLLIVSEFFRDSWKLSGSSFTRLKFLRVLNLVSADVKRKKLASSFGKLIHLRHLSFENTRIWELPSSRGNLILLIYLNLSVGELPIFVPNVLMRMQDLRYLKLPVFMDLKTKLEMSNLVNLETLENFSTEHSNIEDIRGMVRLRFLSITL